MPKLPIICNPHLGKPAYVTASNACEVVKIPCELDKGTPITIDPVDPTELVTPDCVSVVNILDTSDVTEFTYDGVTGQYSSITGGSIIYDVVLGWIVEVGGISHQPITNSANVSGSYCNVSGEILVVVECGKLDQNQPTPECIASIFTSNGNVTLGEFSYNGDGTYSPNDSGQGIITYTTGVGWTLTATGTTYQGGTIENDPSGTYTAPSGATIVLSEAGCGQVDNGVRPDCITMVFASNGIETVPLNFTYNSTSDTYNATSGESISYTDGSGWTLTTTNATYNSTTDSDTPITSYTDGTNSVTFVDCDTTGGSFLSSCVRSIFSDNPDVVLGDFSQSSSVEYTSPSLDQGSIIFSSGWQLIVEINGVTQQYVGSTDPNQVTGAYVATDGTTILITECN